MVSAFIPGVGGLGLTSSRGHCVVFLGKTHNSHSASPPRSINGYRQIVGKPNKLQGNDLQWTSIHPGGVEILLAASCYRSQG